MAAGGVTPRWEGPASVDVSAALRDVVGGPPVLAETLVRRGYDTPERALAFLDPRHYRPAPPGDLPDMTRAADRIERALRDGERIGVWGDFDVDGQTSTTLLVETLRRLGADPLFHIPVRERESHGMGVETLRGFLDEGVTLLLTCDTGVDANEAVEYAASREVDVIITDHHELPEELPAALAVINPKRIESYHPMRSLPGVGVAFQVARELFGRAGRIKESRDLLDLVALGVVADLAEQIDDTRFWLQVGLLVLRRTERVGLQVMMELAELNRETLGEDQISFSLGPRLNAIGRLSDANPMVKLMTTDSHEEARRQALELERLNARRRLLTDQVFDAACEQIEADSGMLDSPGLVLSHSDWPAGVIGIVASRLVERFHRPTLLLSSPPDGPVRGSARSIPGCNVTAAIAGCSELLDGFGGHPMAAGVSLQPEQIEPFRRELQVFLGEQIGDGPPAPSLPIDAVLDLEQTSLDLVDALAGLGPFGPGNKALTFASHGVTIKRVTDVGRSGEHRKLRVAGSTGATRSVMWWKSGDDPVPEGKIDLAYRISAHDYRGKRSLQIELIDARPSAAPTVIAAGTEPPSVVDHRAGDPATGLAQLVDGLAEPAVIWGEGNVAEPQTGRDQVVPAQTLVVWTTPPGRLELQEVLRRVQPRALHLFAVDPQTAQVDQFLECLAGLCKHAVHHHEGRVAVSRLAAATAHRDATVRAGLAWLTGHGDLTVVRQDGESVTLGDGLQADREAAVRAAADLRELLTETAAYREFFATAPIEELIRTL